MTITVANIKTHRGPGVYVGRQMPGRAGSPLANPYRIGPDGTREQVIEKYAGWLEGQLAGRYGPAFRAYCDLLRLHALTDLTLLCWCRPHTCHGDYLKERLEGEKP